MFVKINEEFFGQKTSMNDFLEPILKTVHEEGVNVNKDVSRMIPIERACLAS